MWSILIVNGYDRLRRWHQLHDFGDFDEEEARRYPWIDLCLREVTRRSQGDDYEVLVWDNTQFDEHRELIRRHGARLLPSDEDLARARTEDAAPGPEPPLAIDHADALQRLFENVDPRAELVMTLDTDAFPVRDGWLHAISELLQDASLTGIWRDEMESVLRPFVHPSCLAMRRERLAQMHRPFSFGGVQDVGQRITDELMAAGEQVAPLRRSNARDAHFVLGGLYGDVVYHHGAGSRKPVFRLTEGAEREEHVNSVLRDAAFTDLDHLVAVLRGEAESDLDLDWNRPPLFQPVYGQGPDGITVIGMAPAVDPPAPQRGEEWHVPRNAEELAAMEALYRPFADIGVWRSLRVGRPRWERYAAALAQATAAASDHDLADTQDRLFRAAALDSAALAGFLAPSPELTTRVLQVDMPDANPDADALSEAMHLIVECNRRALVLASEAAADGRPVDENLIAVLYDVITEAQTTFRIEMPDGEKVEVELPRRQYKPGSNYLTAKDGALVPLCPASGVSDEMQRLCRQFASPTFAASHPAVQMAYAHYGIAKIHPFADGNGRLARAVASIFLMRAVGLPLVIFADQWPLYRQATHAGDYDDFQGFLDRYFVFAITTIDLATGLLARSADPIVVRDASKAMLLEESESAAVALVRDTLWIEMHELLPTPPRGASLAVGELRQPVAFEHTTHRAITDGGSGFSGIRVGVAGADRAELTFLPVVARDASDLMPIGVIETTSGALFEASLGDVYPLAPEVTVLRLRAWARRVVAVALEQAPLPGYQPSSS
jgi:hypothetical protein